MAETRMPKRYAPTDLDNSNIAAGAGIATSKLAGGADFVNRNGSIPFTGDQSMGNNKLTNIATPSATGDAANKGYVDTAVSGLTSLFTNKGTVRAATTANITLSGAQPIDGVSIVAGDRVLVKNQTTASANGIYVAASGAWARATDMDTWSEIPGAWVTVQEGSTQADTVYLGTADQGGTLGTTNITFINPLASLGSLTPANFVFDEAPAGTINGSNTTFTLANTPTAGTVRVFISGYRLRAGAGNDYTISGSSITFTTAPLSGEYISVDYLK